jgi:hypothetical protein
MISPMARVVAWSLALVVGCGSSGVVEPPPDAFIPPEDPCTPEGFPRMVGRIRGLPTTELSGLAASRVLDGILYTHGDSGDTATIYAIDETSVTKRFELRLTGVTAIDWEDIVTGRCGTGRCVFVADTGDNNAARASVSIYEVTEPTTAISADVVSRRYDFTYPDGPHDVEALVSDPRDGALYGITKVLNARAKVYRFSLEGEPPVLLGELPTLPGDSRVTGADMFVDDQCGARLLVRSRGGLFALTGAADATVEQLITRNAVPWIVAMEAQGEAVAWRRDGRAYYTTSEGLEPPLTIVDL